MAEVILKEVKKDFGKSTVINDVSIKIKEGEFCIFVGPSGCGKSTITRLVSGLLKPDQGKVYISNQQVTSPRSTVGMAFQIKDDLFDYGSRNIGKPVGIDIKEQKMTLPLIYTLNKVGSKDRRWLINSIKNHNRDKRRVKEVIDKVKQEGGLEFAIEKMQFYREEALAILDGFPDNEFRVALTLMVNYVIDRKI